MPYAYGIIVFLSALLISIAAGRDFIFQSGYLYLAETYEVYSLDQFINVIYPTWNDKLQNFIFADLPKLYVVAPLAAVSIALGTVLVTDPYKIFQAILLISPFFIAFLSSFKLTEYITSKFTNNKFQIFISSLPAAFIFTINPWFATNPRDYMFRLEYAILPLSVYLFLKIIHTNEKKYIVYLALTLAVVATYRNLLLNILILGAIFLIFIFTSKKRTVLSKALSISIVAGLLILLSAAKFIPSILHSGLISTEQAEVFTENRIQRESISHIFTSKIFEWTAANFELTYDDNLYVLYIAVTIFAFSYLLLLLGKRDNISKKQYFFFVFPPIIYISFMLLSAKEINIDGLIVNESNPFADELGRLLRHARWNVMPMLLSLAVMTAVSLIMIISRIKKKVFVYPILAAFLIVTSSISAWPIFSGNMNGYWQPAEPPEDYVYFNSLLREEGDDHHVVWFPQYFDDRAIWSNSTGVSEVAAPTGLFAMRSSALPSYKTADYYFFDYYNPVRGVRGINPLPVYGGNLTEIYEPLNIKYLTITHDQEWSSVRQARGFTNDYLKDTAESLSNSSSVHKIYAGNYLTGFELENNAEELYITKPIVVMDKLSTYGQLSPFLNKESSIIFGTSLKAINQAKDISDNIVLSDSKDLLLLADDKILVEPSGFASGANPRSGWSSDSVHSSAFNDFLFRNGIDWSWSFDFGRGFVYTSAPHSILKIQTDVPQADNYRIFVRYFANDKAGSFKVTIGEESVTVNSIKDYGSTSQWSDLGTHKLEKATNDIILENINGINIINLFVLIPSVSGEDVYSTLDMDLENKDLIYVYEAEHDFLVQSGSSDEIRRRSNTDGIGFIENSTLRLDLDVVKEGDYQFAVKGTGDFFITIQGSSDSASLTLQPRRMNYAHSTPFHLTKGSYELLINAQSSFLDHVFFYSQNENKVIDQMFRYNSTNSAEIVSYEKINPTLHELKIRADEPFLLAFAEGYDKFWSAEIKTTEGVKYHEPIELYGTINGFWINEVGEYDVTIRYQPQEWFQITAVLSASTFVAVMIYLIYPKINQKIKKYVSRSKMQ